jgi:exosortase/archaeosortase family protein
MLKPPPLRQGVYMHLAALAFAAVANVGRIAALCHAAPGYTADQMDSLETYHDVSGIVAFIAAYALLGWLNARWTRVPAEPVTRG